ncbi:MAG: UvrD-helicase domain-containing protein, partial [Pseudomonadota bacterium]
MNVVDAAQRLQVIDPLHSYCVSAPAGSGKTELLIQRYLCLLGRVVKPEQVLAITFTRKAAAEMRERIVQALQGAERGTAILNPHQQRTRDLAKSVLIRDREQCWNLLRDVSRLNIKTIDGFCSTLTRQMPILSQFGGQVQVLDDAD